ncbi:HNH endonuclease [Malaciobacter marinus]|uniref:HNH endonuclease n=1 Tax=Malaciobacter marinus TaxID=505249 RepID=UPI0013FD952E|nr:HNH endonuclease [Malaciobacter marinus]
MKKCFLCNAIITKDNNTKEHIIPNALGGIKKVEGFICNNCNNETGHKWDSKFTKQLNYFSHFFRIKKERGKVQKQELITSSGKKYLEDLEGNLVPRHPTITKSKLDNNTTQFNIQVRDFNELDSQLKSLKKKYSELNIEELKKKAKIEHSYLDEPFIVNGTIGGKEEGKSVVKTVLSFCFSIGIEPTDCDEALEYLINDGVLSFGYYNEREVIKNRPAKKPLHIIHIEAIPDENLLIGYIEYFSIYKILVCLSRKYNGKKVSKSYAIDPTKAKEIKHLNIDISFLKSIDIDDVYNYKKIDYKKWKDDFSQIYGTRFREKREKNKNDAIERAIQKGLEKVGVNNIEQMTDFQKSFFSSIVANEIVNYLRVNNLL